MAGNEVLPCGSGAMNTYKRIATALAVLLLVLTALLVGELYLARQRTANLAQHTRLLAGCYQVSFQVERLVSGVEGYLLSGDRRYTEQFEQAGPAVIREEMELYELAPPGVRSRAAALLEATRVYLAFAERNLAPPGPGGSDARLEHAYLAADLRDKAYLVLDEMQRNVEETTGLVTAGENRQKFTIIALALLLGALVAVGSRGVVLPLLRQNAHLRHLVGALRAGVVLTDRRGVVREVNPAAAQLLGVDRGELTGRSLTEVLARFPHLQGVLDPLLQVILQKKPLLDHRSVHARGDEKALLVADYQPLFTFGRFGGALMILLPGEAREDRHLLLDRMETERKKLAIEIHDWIGRDISPLIHSLDYLLRQHGEELPVRVREALRELRTRCQQAAMDMRSIMNEVHPYLIDRAGLLPALESYLSHFEKTYGIKVYVYYPDPGLPLDGRQGLLIYRIIQEALTNIARHSRATEVDIYCAVQDETLRIQIADNGGPGKEFAAGAGLWGMKERAGLLGGDLTYGYTDTGFHVTLTIPLGRGAMAEHANDQSHAGGGPPGGARRSEKAHRTRAGHGGGGGGGELPGGAGEPA
ncbi:MAG: PAS domain-containing protein [Bacillota bacterium]